MKLIDATIAADKLSAAYNILMADLVDTFATVPAVDAVPVIRCRECIHRQGDEYPMCMLHTEPCANTRGYKGEAVCVEMDGFCNYGERRKATK